MTSRRLMVAMAFASALSAGPAAADNLEAPPADVRTWTLQVDPLTTALGYVHLQVERRLGDSFSVYLGPHARLYDGIRGDDEPFIGLGAEMGARWYIRGGAPAGWWVMARAVVAHIESDVDTAVGGYASALGGYTWMFRNRWVLSAGLGAQYIHYAVGDLGTKGVLPAAHTTLGIAF